MEQMIRAFLQAKGVQAPEQDYPILVAQWESILAMKQQAMKAKLGDFNIALCHTLKGGMPNEE